MMQYTAFLTDRARSAGITNCTFTLVVMDKVYARSSVLAGVRRTLIDI